MNVFNVVIYAPGFQYNSGGCLGLYNLAKNIKKQGIDCKVFNYSNGRQKSNLIFNDYARIEDIKDNTVVIYPEVIFGNPLQARNVVRLILCELGIHLAADTYSTWNQDDLIYHWSTYNSEKSVKNTNLLYCIHIDPAIKNYQENNREGYCYIIRKGYKFHQPLEFVHPPDALFLEDNLSQKELVKAFNKKKYLISYDPYSFINFIAALCGCIPIIVPMKGISKEKWLESLSLSIFLREQGESELKGIAYGIEEVEYAAKTLHEARNQQNLRIEHGEQTVLRFVNDLHYLFSDGQKNLYPRNKNIFRVSDFYDLEEKHYSSLLTLIVTWSDSIDLIENWRKNLRYTQECQIIFINNLRQKTDKIALEEFCEHHNIKIIHHKQDQPIALAKNQALSIATGYSVLVLSSNMMIKYFSAGYLCRLTGNNQILVPSIRNELFTAGLQAWRFCAKKSVLEKLGGWNEDYDSSYLDDINFCYRAKLAGYAINKSSPISQWTYHKATPYETGREHQDINTYLLNCKKFIVQRFKIILNLFFIYKDFI